MRLSWCQETLHHLSQMVHEEDEEEEEDTMEARGETVRGTHLVAGM